MPIASAKPRRKTTPSRATRKSATSTFCPCRKDGANGFSMACAAASAAERVMVMRKSVRAKPSRTRTKSLPHQNGKSRSSMAIDPWPCGLSRATRR